MGNKRWYYFTFGYGHEHAGKFVKFYGTREATREVMFQEFGDKWAFQYAEHEVRNLKDEFPDMFRDENELKEW